MSKGPWKRAGGAQLYRHFDADGRLLYVGISVSTLVRLGSHSSMSPWFRSITTVTIEHFDTRKQAEEAERRAIMLEAPIHNRKLPAEADPFTHGQIRVGDRVVAALRNDRAAHGATFLYRADYVARRLRIGIDRVVELCTDGVLMGSALPNGVAKPSPDDAFRWLLFTDAQVEAAKSGKKSA